MKQIIKNKYTLIALALFTVFISASIIAVTQKAAPLSTVYIISIGIPLFVLLDMVLVVVFGNLAALPGKNRTDQKVLPQRMSGLVILTSLVTAAVVTSYALKLIETLAS